MAKSQEIENTKYNNNIKVTEILMERSDKSHFANGGFRGNVKME